MENSKTKLFERYFNLEKRLENLNRLKNYVYYNETFRLIRVNKLIFKTKRKVDILQKHLSKSQQ